MNLRLSIGAVLLFVLSLLSSSSAFAQSDRENAGLRGPVSAVIENTGTTKYSPDGKLLTSDAVLGGHVQIIYERGVKTTVQTFDSETQGTRGEYFFPWNSAARGDYVPKGGNATTLYNENDQPTELQVRNADGTILIRFVPTYNTNGRVTEEKMILENPGAYFVDNLSQEQRAKMGGPAEFKKIVAIESSGLRGKSQVGAFYTFDEQNRLVKKVERGSMLEKTTIVTNNDQGDEVEEQITFADNMALPSGVSLGIDKAGNAVQIDPREKPTPRGPVRQGYTVRYTYQYDSFGNWIQQTEIMSMDSMPDITTVRNREISYYK
jgi:hypothetical protein